MQSGARDTMGGADGSQQTSAAALSWVINLCASMTPNQISPILVPGIDAYRVYQISRKEDGRQRYRLRVGFFDNQSEAQELLSKLRELYPAAFVTSLCSEDQKFARGYTVTAKPKSEAKPAPAPVKAEASAPTPARPTPPTAARVMPTPSAKAPSPPPAEPAKPAAVAPALKPEAVAAKKPERPTIAPTPEPASPPPVLTLDVEWESAAPAPVRAPAADKATPFHVARGVALPKLEFELLADDTPAELGHQPTVEPEESVRATARVDTDLEPLKRVRPAMPAQPKQLDASAPLPSFDSTVTIRALTSEELDDENQQQWFVVQLAASEKPVNLETMPRLDIFTAYRLYSVATTEGRTVTHSLRLGFFTENVSAEAVCGYLKTFFGAPKVVRISTAEQNRFSNQPQPKIFEDPSPTGQVIELATPKPVKPIQLGANSGVDRRQAPRHDKDMADLEMKLMQEARLTETGMRRMEKNSLLSRLVGKLTK
jgi:hypothetical protein